MAPKKNNGKGNLSKPKPMPKPNKSFSKMSGTGQAKSKNRAEITAREARDIITALGTIASRALTSPKYRDPGNPVKNLGRQIKETGVAAATGKKGTTSDRFGKQVKGKPYGTINTWEGYEKGKKRR